jgi:hypothetical protein
VISLFLKSYVNYAYIYFAPYGGTIFNESVRLLMFQLDFLICFQSKTSSLHRTLRIATLYSTTEKIPPSMTNVSYQVTPSDSGERMSGSGNDV